MNPKAAILKHIRTLIQQQIRLAHGKSDAETAAEYTARAKEISSLYAKFNDMQLAEMNTLAGETFLDRFGEITRR
jgi:hypothetical protein